MAHSSKEKPIAAGKSSFGLIDSKKLFSELRLKSGETFLDMACGKGLYAIAAAEAVGDDGTVYAIDLWEEGITTLRQQAAVKAVNNIKAIVGDVSKRMPIENDSVDVCLLATVLHDLVQIKAAEGALSEIVRVLGPKGSLAIVEFKKIVGPPGPPINIRLSADEVEDMVIPYGFRIKLTVDIGPHNYLAVFDRLGAS